MTSTPPKKPPSEHPEETGNSRVSAALSFIISQISSDNMMISRQNLKQVCQDCTVGCDCSDVSGVVNADSRAATE